MVDQVKLESDIEKYIKAQEHADEMLEVVADSVQSLYNDVDEYRKDEIRIKTYIRKALPEYKQQVLDTTDELIEKNQLKLPENKELKNKRDNYIADIKVYFHRIGRASFGSEKYNKDNKLSKTKPDKRKRAKIVKEAIPENVVSSSSDNTSKDQH